jgi:hypothetical protein
VYIAGKLKATATAAATVDTVKTPAPKSPNSTITGLQYVEDIRQEVPEAVNDMKKSSLLEHE